MKTKEHGNISFKEFMMRWKEGMLSITPQQQAHSNMTAYLWTFIGAILATVFMVVYASAWHFTLFMIGIIYLQWTGFKKERKNYFEIRNAMQQLEQNKISIKEEEKESSEDYKKLMEEMNQE